MSDFFSTLNYSSCNEDWRTERIALGIGQRDRVLCVTGSGDRPLNLLLDSPQVITAIDSNQTQCFLLELKVAALKRLEFPVYSSFLGLKGASGLDIKPQERLKILKTLRMDLSLGARDYWDRNSNSVRLGILYQGRWEKYYRKVGWFAQRLRGPAIQKLFKFRSLEEQSKFIDRDWNKGWWKKTYEIICSRIFSRIFFRDPAFFKNADPVLNVGAYLYDRMIQNLHECLAQENFMISLLFTGKLPELDLPPCLDEVMACRIRSNLNRLNWETASLIEFMEKSEPGRFTCFSLSDVPSFLDQSQFERMLKAMIHAGEDGASFCIRQFLTNHRLPEDLEKFLVRDTSLELDLEKKDRAFAYRFLVGRIRKH